MAQLALGEGSGNFGPGALPMPWLRTYLSYLWRSSPSKCSLLGVTSSSRSLLPGPSVGGISLSKDTGVACHSLLQEIFLTQGLNTALQLCRWTLHCLSHQAPITLELYLKGCSRIQNDPAGISSLFQPTG